MEESDRGRSTHFLEAADGGRQVSTWKERTQTKDTHFSETIDGGGRGTSQDVGIRQPNERHL
jgi:hypothetical protein